MLKAIESKMMDQNSKAVKYIDPQIFSNPTNELSRINEQIKRDFGLAGPMTLAMPSIRVHIARWACAREGFVVETHVKRIQKEMIAACISKINKCPYCVDVHGTSIMSIGDNITGEAIKNNTWNQLKDDKTKKLIDWSLNTRNPNAEIIKNPPFNFEQAAEIIGTALIFHSTNRMVSIFLDKSPLPSLLSSKLMNKMALKIASKTLFKSMVNKKASAGDSLIFFNQNKITGNHNWASAVPDFEKAMAHDLFVVQEIGKTVIPKNIASVFHDKINNWKGEEMPFGRNWMNELLTNLDENEKQIGKIALLAAFAPYSITSQDIAGFRIVNASDEALIETCYWAIQVLTNRIGTWLTQPFM